MTVPSGAAGIDNPAQRFGVGPDGQDNLPFQSRTEDAIKTILKSQKKPGIDDAFSGFNSGLGSTLLNIFNGTGGNLSGPFALAQALLSGRWGQVSSAQASSQQAITKAESAASAVASQGAQVQAVKAAILQFQEGIPLQPFSHSLTNSEMTFDRVDLRPEPVSFSGNATTSSNGSHTHTVSGSFTGAAGSHTHTVSLSGALTTAEPVFTPIANAVYGGFIRAKWGGLRESFTIAVGSVTSPCSIRAIVGIMDATSGDISIKWVSGDLSSTLGSSSIEYICPIPSGILIADRDTVFLAVQQYGSGNVRPIYGKRVSSPPRDGLLYPAKQNARFGSSSALTAGSTISAGSLLFDDDNLPWIGIGQSLTIPVPPALTLYEDFSSKVITSQLVQRGQYAGDVSSGDFFYGGGFNDASSEYQFAQKMNRDNGYTEFMVLAPNGAVPCWVTRRGDSSNFNSVACEVYANSVRIVKRGNSAGTLASASTTVVETDIFQFYTTGNQYMVYRVNSNGSTSVVLSYTDTSNAIPSGISNRYVGFGTRRNFFNNGGGIAYVLSKDES